MSNKLDKFFEYPASDYSSFKINFYFVWKFQNKNMLKIFFLDLWIFLIQHPKFHFKKLFFSQFAVRTDVICQSWMGFVFLLSAFFHVFGWHGYPGDVKMFICIYFLYLFASLYLNFVSHSIYLSDISSRSLTHYPIYCSYLFASRCLFLVLSYSI